VVRNDGHCAGGYLKFPADKLRELNLTLENGAWGAFDTAFYPTYDYMPVWKEQQSKKTP
jgi:hypothetical protein